MKHIKTPLLAYEFDSIGGFSDVQDAEGMALAEDLYTQEAKELVQAVNAHDALVAALKSFAVVATAIKRMPWGDLHPVWQFDDVVLTAGDFRRAAAALALTEEAE